MLVGLIAATDLRQVLPSSLFREGMRAEVAAVGGFAWSTASLAADDGATVIKPNDVAPGDPGRWLKMPSAGALADLHFALSGVYSGAVVPGFFDPPLYVDVGFALAYARLDRRTAGTVGATQVDVLKNGVTIFGAGGPSVAAGAGDYATDTNNVFAPGANVFVPGDWLEVQLVTVETFAPGPPPGPEGLRVTLVKVLPHGNDLSI